ncbi:MAG TPA: alpha/beta hydrolase [Acidimicrobiales bacterium]|nr:alpha/beta hydrolase [Acidimicrobiales bacterium]
MSERPAGRESECGPSGPAEGQERGATSERPEAGGITQHNVEANGLTFAYLAAGDPSAPLALCLHGFPDSAWTWRHLLPFLAGGGYRAVAPWLRGYAPTTVPSDGRYQSAVLGLDACALHEALGGGDDAVLIGHDWGAFAAYAAVHRTTPWRRVVTLAVPPPATISSGFFSYDQLRRSWYMFFFQHPLAELALPMDDLGFIERLWADWSPGYDASADLPHVKDALRDAANLNAAIGYNRATLGGVGLDPDPEVRALQDASAGPPPLPTLYLHGRTDGCMGADLAELAGAALTTPGSRAEIVDDAGHFLHLERPDVVNGLIAGFLAEG